MMFVCSDACVWFSGGGWDWLWTDVEESLNLWEPLLRQMPMGFLFFMTDWQSKHSVVTGIFWEKFLSESHWSTVCICSRCALKSVPFFYRQWAAGSLRNKLSREPCNSEWGEVQPWGLEYHLFLYAGDLPEHQPSCVSPEVQVASYSFLIFLPHKFIFSMYLVTAGS